MKKAYLKPSTVTEHTKLVTMLCLSDGIYSDYGIEYGGVDGTGERIPTSRHRNKIWDEWEDY